MDSSLIAKSTIIINATIEKVWDGLVNPDIIKKYMFGSIVRSEWREGSPIIWTGEWQGKSYEDRGVILPFDPLRSIQYSHFSPLSGLPDLPENYHLVTIELIADDGLVELTLLQDNNSSDEDRKHSEQNWNMMLAGMKKVIEG